MKALLTSVVFGVAMSALPPAQSSDPLNAAVTKIVATFDKPYRDGREQPAFPAAVEVRTHPSLESYQLPHRTMRVSNEREN